MTIPSPAGDSECTLGTRYAASRADFAPFFSPFDGTIDEARISDSVRYDILHAGQRLEPDKITLADSHHATKAKATRSSTDPATTGTARSSARSGLLGCRRPCGYR